MNTHEIDTMTSQHIEQQLLPLRQQIDAIDQTLLHLLNQRAQLAQQIGDIKHTVNLPVYRPEREAQVLAQLAAQNQGPLPNYAIALLFREVMSACRALERQVVVAYLGPAGTFSEQAAMAQFGQSVRLLPCPTIDEIFRVTETQGADYGVVPVENSAEGVVNRTLDLLLQTSLIINAEISLPIVHHLLTLSGDMTGITQISAHPQALAQCQQFLNSHYPHVSRIATQSNAEAATLASQSPHIAAIAGEFAQHHYGLQAAATAIQDDAHNRTRFAILGRQRTQSSGADQTSLILSVVNSAGAVHQLLQPLATHGVSMTRFESRPARQGKWEYYFYVDIEGHQDDAPVKLALSQLAELAAFYKVLGSYPLTHVGRSD
jgi:chorismate mutase/prephenate dehydratase